MSTGITKHVHKLKKHTYPNKTSVYFCLLNCNFKIEVAMSVGKVTLCNLCGEPFTMTEYHTRLVRPHCSKCSRVRTRDDDGKVRYVRPTSTLSEVSKTIAKSSIKNLRDRLEQVTSDEHLNDV